jgi:hypothetical protein
LPCNFPDINRMPGESFKFKHVSCQSVFQQIMKLDSHKRGGINEVPALVYQAISDLIVEPLTILINESFDTHIFPDCLKIALVTPIFKKGSSSQPSNYRPISSLPIVSKLFEINIKDQLMTFLENHNLLSDHQFGYRKHHSSEQLLQSLLQDWRSKLDSKEPCYISALSLDVRKAFDSINHSILISKLPKYGLSNNSVHLIQSYLSNRFQSMKISSIKSSLLPIKCGVPQGSILGPILFLLAINDLLATFCSSYAYADDTIIYAEGRTIEQSAKNGEQLMQQVQGWYQNNMLQLNFSKVKYCIFSNRQSASTPTINLENTCISPDKTLSLLGVTLDSHLTFDHHISAMCAKTSRLVYLTSKFRKYLNVDEALRTYSTIVRPCLEYCPSLLLNISQRNSNLVEGIQNRAIRIILSAPRKFSITSGRLLLNLPTLSSRREYLFAKFIEYKLSKLKASRQLLKLVRSSSSHSRSLRSKHHLIKPYYRTHYGKGSFLSMHHTFLSDAPSFTNPKERLKFQI